MRVGLGGGAHPSHPGKDQKLRIDGSGNVLDSPARPPPPPGMGPEFRSLVKPVKL